MKLKDIKETKVASYKELVELFDQIVEQYNSIVEGILTEAVSPLDPDLDLEGQLAELSKRMEAARRALGLTNKLQAGVPRTMHRKRIMGNLNSIRAQLSRVVQAIEQFDSASDDYEAGRGHDRSQQDFADRGTERNWGGDERRAQPRTFPTRPSFDRQRNWPS